MVRVAGYSAANPVAVADCLTDEVKRDLHLDDLDYAEGLDFWKLASPHRQVRRDLERHIGSRIAVPVRLGRQFL